jgi:dihydrofolate reductase
VYVTAFARATANGMISWEGAPSNRTSDTHLEAFIEASKRSKCVVMDKETYEKLTPDRLPLKNDGITAVLTPDTFETSENPTVIFTDKSPKDLLALLDVKGFEDTYLLGGSLTIFEFASKGLVDELYLDIEPWLSGTDLPRFRGANFEIGLRLVDMTRLDGGDTVRLHYRVRREP